MWNRLASWRHITAGVLAIGLLASCAAMPAHHGRMPHRAPADLQEYLRKLDRPERDHYQKPSQVMETLALNPGMAVADLGTGSGYFTRRFVRTVTESGMVYAIDIEQEMLDYTRRSIEDLRIPYSAQFILASSDDPKLPADSVDLIFVCNVYHHLEDRSSYFAKVQSALKPGGRVAIIDFYHDSRSGEIGFPRRHLVARETVVEELGKAGYTLVREHEFLPRQYFLEFSVAP